MFSKNEKIALCIVVVEAFVIGYLERKIVKLANERIEKAGCKNASEYFAKFRKAREDKTLVVDVKELEA